MVLKSYSKINLSLSVNSRLKSGLHEIQSYYCLINLSDKIEIYNHIGQLIETQSNRPFFTVDITKQKGGIFLIKAYFGNQVKSTIVSYL